MSVNVKIPFHLLVQTIYLLECIDVSKYDLSIKIDYENILDFLCHKKASLQLRETYANIIKAKDDDSRHTARMRYLQEKRELWGDNS